MVYKSSKISKSTFRKLPFGAAYWLATDTSVAPFIKTGRATRAGTFATDTFTNTAVALTDVAVVRVPKVFLTAAV